MIANGVSLLLGLELVPGPRAGWQAGLLLTLPRFPDQGTWELPSSWASMPTGVERVALHCAALHAVVASSGWPVLHPTV